MLICLSSDIWSCLSSGHILIQCRIYAVISWTKCVIFYKKLTFLRFMVILKTSYSEKLKLHRTSFFYHMMQIVVFPKKFSCISKFQKGSKNLLWSGNFTKHWHFWHFLMPLKICSIVCTFFRFHLTWFILE